MLLLVKRGFGVTNQGVQNQCICHYQFGAFISGFPSCNFSYGPKMPIINLINCITKSCTKAYPFAPSMASKSTTASNISVFENLIEQMGLVDYEDTCLEDQLTIWWGDLKTKVQMLSMQSYSISAARAFDRYRHIFPGLALGHLQFNYLKMVWELFYPGRSVTERSTLQWATDYWHQDKTTNPNDFHSLKKLKIHSYRARIIAILKPWIQL